MKDGLGTYYRQMMAPIRELTANAEGNWVARYESAGKADRYAHAEVYCRLALEWGPNEFATGSVDPPGGREHRLRGDGLLHHERPSIWR